VTPPSIVVRPGQLESTVEDAPAGAVLHLSAGDHRLSRPLKIGKPLSLIGEGMYNTRVTRVTFEGYNHYHRYVVAFFGGGPLVVRGLGFANESTDPMGDLVQVHAHKGVQITDTGPEVYIDIQHCRFTGGDGPGLSGVSGKASSRQLMNKGNSVPKACIARLEIEDRVEPELSLDHPALQYSPRLSTMVIPSDNLNRTVESYRESKVVICPHLWAAPQRL
jgi:hypothetical protein